jgi:hypothetical protein
MHVVGYNTTDRPVLLDAEGRSLGGGEFGAVDTTSDEVKAAVDRGDLQLLRNLKDDGELEAVAAAALAEVNELEAARKATQPDTDDSAGITEPSTATAAESAPSKRASRKEQP